MTNLSQEDERIVALHNELYGSSVAPEKPKRTVETKSPTIWTNLV